MSRIVPLLLLLTTCRPDPAVVDRPGASPAQASREAASPVQTPNITGGTLHLVRDGDAWFIAGWSADALLAVEQGRLFAVLRPLAPDSARPIAVLAALGPVVDKLLPVAPQCVIPGAALSEGLSVMVLSSATAMKVGPCLSRIVDHGRSEHGEDYVVLDVGFGVGVRPGDQFLLLGHAVTAPGFVPLGLGSDNDGMCQVPADTLHLKVSTARCAIVHPASGGPKSLHAVWMPEPPP